MTGATEGEPTLTERILRFLLPGSVWDRIERASREAWEDYAVEQEMIARGREARAKLRADYESEIRRDLGLPPKDSR